MKKEGLAVLITALGFSGLFGVSEEVELQERPLFKVYVLGGKVGSNPCDDDLPPNAEDVWRGALWACEKDKLCTAPAGDLADTKWRDLRLGQASPAGALFRLVPNNDCWDPQQAARIAENIQKEPAALTVVGHSTSRTTGRVAEIYARAGIPLIMPEATAAMAATYASRRTGASAQVRVPNYVRLQPSDDQAQAPAVAYTILQLREQNKTSRLFLLTGLDRNAQEYSEGLVDEVRRLLKNKIQGDALVRLRVEERENSQVAQTLHAQARSYDIVFFAGYREQADAILEALNALYGDQTPEQRPFILLPEACSGLESKWEAFRLYRTGPADTKACVERLNDPGLERWRRAEEKDLLPVSMLYGHDAVRLVSRAIEACRQQGITRSCVLEQLRATVSSGVCGGYSFRQGENLLSSYYVFHSPNIHPLQTAQEASKSCEIDPVDIIRIQDIGAGQ